MKHTTHAQTQQQQEGLQVGQKSNVSNPNISEGSLDRPRLYAHWVEVNGKLMCQWYSD